MPKKQTKMEILNAFFAPLSLN